MTDKRPSYERSFLTEAQYTEICAACDSVLFAPDSGDARVAIPWMHVIREHPVILGLYAGVLEGDSSGQALSRSVRTLARLLLLPRSIARSDTHGPTPSMELRCELDVLFVSHLLNGTTAGAESDFYFGDWPRALARRGLSVGIALINHSGASSAALAHLWKGSSVPRLILSEILTTGEEWKLVKSQSAEAARLHRSARVERDMVKRRVLRRAALEALSPATFGSLRIARQVSSIVERYRPSSIVITHEGHSWERLAFSSARSARPGMRCIAYQHALLFRLQHAVLRDLQPQYNPDHVLTSGEAARERFCMHATARRISITNAGSERGDIPAPVAPALGSNSTPAGVQTQACCLVLPEGFVGESNLLIGFAVRCAKVVPDMKFILRLHPLISFQQLAANNPELSGLPANVTLSTASLNEDIASSTWTLYRGSTAAVQAVAAGVIPIYLRVRDELSIDPLFEAGDRVPRVQSVDEFVAAVRHRRTESDMALLKTLCARLFSPRDIGKLLECLGASDNG